MNGLILALTVVGVFALIAAFALVTDKPQPAAPFAEPDDVDAEHRANVVEMFRVKP